MTHDWVWTYLRSQVNCMMIGVGKRERAFSPNGFLGGGAVMRMKLRGTQATHSMGGHYDCGRMRWSGGREDGKTGRREDGKRGREDEKREGKQKEDAG